MSGYLDTAIQVNITATSATLSVPDTTIPALIGYHTYNTDLIRSYTDLTGMTSDGFLTTDPLYLMALNLVSQNPRPAEFRVIRGTTAAAQTTTFVVTNNTVGASVGFTLTLAGVATDCHHVVTAGQTTTQVATAIATLADAAAGITSTNSASTTVTTLTTAAGAIAYQSAVFGGTFTDNTATAAPGTDLDAALLVDNSWYGITGEWVGETNITLVAAWAEANKKMHFYSTGDSAPLAGTGVFASLHALSYYRSVGLYETSPGNFGSVGWLARGLVTFPGAYNFAYKTIAGDTVDVPTPTNITNMQADNGNFTISMAGVNVAIDGRSAQGQFADIQIGVDGLTNDIRVSVGTLLVTVPKLPYTGKGMAAVQSAVAGALQRAVDGGFLSNDAGYEFAVTIPQLKNVSASDKQNRILRNVNFTATAQGAINKVIINGTVSI